MTAHVLVHADGGACHGTPIVEGRCPKCGISPDMQSLELWPRPVDPSDAGAISDMERPIVLSPADADRVAALIEERPEPTEAMRALFAERQPCGGWYKDSPWRWMLPAGCVDAEVSDCRYWSVEAGERTVAHGEAPTLEAAQLAAEDALLAVADEIRRAVGR